MVRFEARRYGVSIIGSEIVGLVPMEALIDTASYYLGLETSPCSKYWKRRLWNNKEIYRHEQQPYQSRMPASITRLGTSALKGKEMNQLLDLTGGTVKVTDGVITYAGPSRPTCEEPEEGYEILDAEGRVLLPGFIDSHTHLVFGAIAPKNLFGA